MGLDVYVLVLKVKESFDIRIPNADMQRVRSAANRSRAADQ